MPSADPDRMPKSRGWAVAGVCAAMLLAFALTAWAAARTKCATMDEPLHATAAYMLTRYGDYQINPEDPPLWQRWAMLAEPQDALRVDPADAHLTEALSNFTARWYWFLPTLYQTPGNDPVAFIMRQRTMLILLGMFVGALIGCWAWRLHGAAAAIVATGLFALDPNFLAHSAVVKNDVAITLVSLGLAYATWRAGVRLTVWSTLAIVALAAAGLVTKFSGPLLILWLVGLLVLRALHPAAWTCFGRAIRGRAGKLGVALALLVACGVASDLAIWANYSFRFLPTPGGASWQLDGLLREEAISEIEARHGGAQSVDPAEFAAWKPPAFVRTVLFLESHHLLPQTYLVGLLFTHASVQVRDAFLCGRIYNTGSIAYFPLALLFKTPLATQLMLLLAAIATARAGLAARRRRTTGEPPAAVADSNEPRGWTLACLWLPFAVFAAAAMSSHLNIGIRHILPLYPVLYIVAGCGAARLWRQGGRGGRLAIALLGAGLAVETIAAFPNYIPFFNAACGGPRGGIDLLGDSNLDWGQDLPLLARWQREHPDRKLYLCYFGSADPVYYGIRYTPLPGTRVLHDRSAALTLPNEPGVIAVSATVLQGMYTNPVNRQIYGTLREGQAPLAVLGGSIYLYEYNPQ